MASPPAGDRIHDVAIASSDTGDRRQGVSAVPPIPGLGSPRDRVEVANHFSGIGFEARTEARFLHTIPSRARSPGCPVDRPLMGFPCPLLGFFATVHSRRALRRAFGRPVPPGRSRSDFAVSHRPAGLLRSRSCGLVASRCPTWGFVAFPDSGGSSRTLLRTGLDGGVPPSAGPLPAPGLLPEAVSFPATRLPFEAFPSPTAAPPVTAPESEDPVAFTGGLLPSCRCDSCGLCAFEIRRPRPLRRRSRVLPPRRAVAGQHRLEPDFARQFRSRRSFLAVPPVRATRLRRGHPGAAVPAAGHSEECLDPVRSRAESRAGRS
jgi:hypothetical protein